MKLFNIINTFRKDEDGAVTVDWVVLTAAIVGLGIAVLAQVSGGTTALAGKIGDEMNSLDVVTYTTGGGTD